ncbi:MAG: M1 family metallopeptidase [Chitinophagaceae bacterium]
MLQKAFTSAVFLISFSALNGQSSLPVPRNIRPAYEKGTRTADGKPGKNYWQNTASYDIKVLFEPDSRLLKGTVDIDYVNNSPDTLKQVWFKLYPNVYKNTSPRAGRIDSADLGNGVSIHQLTVNGNELPEKERRVNGTNMTVNIPPLATGQHIKFTINWSYILNKGSHNRTGEVEPGADFVAYFFPRIAVYDDIDGWNKYPYLGSLEFYNDFCHFKAAITVPNKQMVWATGDLTNAEEVLSYTTNDRLAQSEKYGRLMTVVDSSEIGTTTKQNRPYNTWKFEADSVTDFVFACSDHYMWRSVSVVVDKQTNRKTRVDAVFNPKHWEYYPVIEEAQKTVEFMSYRFPKWPFPYSHETVFDGLDQMEYPMMVNDNPLQDRAESIELTDHEIFHTMFPFYMGINETKYAWMDEGWATIGEWLISPMIDSNIVDEYGVEATSTIAGKETDLPVITLSTETNTSYFTNSYPKPAMGYLFVKDMLGDDLFLKGLHYYISQWHGRHPIPYDFFNCMNTGTGKNLNWFWKKWFFDDGEPNLALEKVVAAGSKPSATVVMKGNKPVPVDIKVTYTDGSVKKVHRSIAVWEKGNTAVTIPLPGGKIKSLSLGDAHTPDTDKKDNVWPVLK